MQSWCIRDGFRESWHNAEMKPFAFQLQESTLRLHFPLDITLTRIRWYAAYSLSTRNLEEMMAERGVCVDHAICTSLGVENPTSHGQDLSSAQGARRQIIAR